MGLTLALFVTRVGRLTAEKVAEESNILLSADHESEWSSAGVRRLMAAYTHLSCWFGPAGVSDA